MAVEVRVEDVLVIFASVRASEAVASRAWNTSGATCALALARALFRIGCAEASSRPKLDVPGEMLAPRARFGDEDIVVTVVVAVRGLSMDEVIALLDELGITPVISSLLIRDLISSSSSQTVEGAVVETEDSVPSAPTAGGEGS